MAAGSLCVRGHLTRKMNITFFYQKLDAEYFFIRQFFLKKAVFSEKTVKNCFWDAFDNFFGLEGVFCQKLT